MKTLLIIDDHDVVRSGLSLLLGKSWQILGTAATLDEAKKLFKSLDSAPDLILLDLQLGKEWGLDIFDDKSFGRGKFPPVLVFSVYDDFAHINAALRAGAKGYVCKSQSTAELLEAMEDVSSGKYSFPPDMLQHYATTSDKLQGLNKREHTIFFLIQQGKTNKEIAEEMGVTLRTIENNLSILYDKTGVKDRKELEKL